VEDLLRNVYAGLTLDRAQRVVRFTRTSAPYPTLAAYDAEVTAITRSLAPIDRRSLTLLVDLRLAPMRNDLGSEAIATRFRRDVLRGFARVAVLVATQVGKLQITRHGHEDGEGPRTFLSEDDAMAYLAAARPALQ
jgi:hypothetical protein